jgi:hypothetical protein
MIVTSNLQGAWIGGSVVLMPGTNAILKSAEKALRENKHFQAQCKAVGTNGMKHFIVEEDMETKNPSDAPLKDVEQTGDPILDEANAIMSMNKATALKAIAGSLNLSALIRVVANDPRAPIVAAANVKITEIKGDK